MTLQQVADLTGLSKPYLSQIENGRKGLDSRTRLRQLADALRVAPTDLTGEPYPLDAPGLGAVQAAVPSVEAALMDIRIGDRTVEPRTLDELEAEVRGPLQVAAHKGDSSDLLRMLSGLIAELQAFGHDERALRLLVAACIDATHGLRHVGQVSLAWIAAERAAEAAGIVGDPVLVAAGEYARAHSRPTAGQGMARASRAADQIPVRLVDADKWAQEVYGMLRLTAALAAQSRGDADTADAQAAEAARVAAVHGERKDTWECFGPTNVAVWRTMLAVEAGEPAVALKHAAGVDVAVLAPWRRRRADLLLETARAHHQMGHSHRMEAVAALRQAERLAPDMRASPWARGLVEVMLTQSMYESGSRELRGLAYRMGLDAS